MIMTIIMIIRVMCAEMIDRNKCIYIYIYIVMAIYSYV